MRAALGGALPLRFYHRPGLRWVQDGAHTWIAEHRRLLRGITPCCQSHGGCTADA